MYCFLIAALTISFTHSASSGAKKCDALGLCTDPSSGAYLNPTTGEIGCPWGMHLVTPPERSDAYIVSTAPYGEAGPSSYTPGQIMDIHVITVGPQYMKFLGILMYAVQVSDGLGPEGCPSPGCDGKDEVKLGSWEVTNKMFQVSEPCNGQAITHRNADPKPYHNVFRWLAPEAGSGDVMFRVVIKQGSTNMGHFWWPMTAGDLMLTEGSTSSISEWFSGDVSQTCAQICAAENRECDRSMPTGNLDHYSDHVGKTQSCQLPLLSTCSRTAPSRDEEGYCWFDNQDSGLCDQTLPSTNICDAVEVAGGSERLCPCKPSDDDGWVAQSTSAPSPSPSTSPVTSLPTTGPTASNPSIAPTNWFDPRWEEVYRGTTSCSEDYRFSRPCHSGAECSFAQCKQYCTNASRCKYFFFRPSRGYCKLFNGCDVTQASSSGITVRKDVIPTNEPSYVPTASMPSSYPSSSTPTYVPTISEPTSMPTTDEPTIAPSKAPTTSKPTIAPSTWDTPRWHVEVEGGFVTCGRKERVAFPCRRHCYGDYCREQCEGNPQCHYYFQGIRGKCELFKTCNERRAVSKGTIWRKELLSGPLDG